MGRYATTGIFLARAGQPTVVAGVLRVIAPRLCMVDCRRDVSTLRRSSGAQGGLGPQALHGLMLLFVTDCGIEHHLLAAEVCAVVQRFLIDAGESVRMVSGPLRCIGCVSRFGDLVWFARLRGTAIPSAVSWVVDSPAHAGRTARRFLRVSLADQA